MSDKSDTENDSEEEDIIDACYENVSNQLSEESNSGQQIEGTNEEHTLVSPAIGSNTISAPAETNPSVSSYSLTVPLRSPQLISNLSLSLSSTAISPTVTEAQNTSTITETVSTTQNPTAATMTEPSITTSLIATDVDVERQLFVNPTYLREAFKNKNDKTYGIFHMLVDPPPSQHMENSFVIF